MSVMEDDTNADWSALQSTLSVGTVLVTASESAPWGQALLTQNHVLFADEPAQQNGRDSGPAPTEMVLMALGSCTAITVRMYAARKGWPIDRLAVRLRYDDPVGAEPKPVRRRSENQKQK